MTELSGHPLSLDGDSMLRQLEQLAKLGHDPDSGGCTRLALTDDDKAARDQLVDWMRELDLDIAVDRIGNIVGTLQPAGGDGAGSPLLLGSHLDTVRDAGALDGSYGVLAGLAVIRAFRSARLSPSRPLGVAAFTNEEGVRYQPDMMGSLVAAGGLGLQAALDTVGTDGTRLGDELERIGYAGDCAPGIPRPHEFLELHIEQGPILEAEKVSIGAVENLQGISWQEITLRGHANHAGTTPMHLRHDAGWAAASVVGFVRDLALRSRTTLATVGSLRFEPDVINVIPRKAVLTLDLRDPDEQRLSRAEDEVAGFLERLAKREGITVEARQLARYQPVSFDAGMVGAIEASAAALGYSHRRMTSGAGHDAQMIARVAPAAMIFVQSRGGISHDPREHTDDEHLIGGARVLLDAVCGRLAAA